MHPRTLIATAAAAGLTVASGAFALSSVLTPAASAPKPTVNAVAEGTPTTATTIVTLEQTVVDPAAPQADSTGLPDASTESDDSSASTASSTSHGDDSSEREHEHESTESEHEDGSQSSVQSSSTERERSEVDD